MKKFRKSILGVTLLEVMLVLAIAAMVIVMSVRYYQSASTSNQVNMTMSIIQNITAAMDNLAIGTGSYANITAAQITAVVGAGNMISPTGGTVVVTPCGGAGCVTYAVTIPVNDAICVSVLAKLAAISKINLASPAPACAGGTLNYTYDNAQ